MNTSHWCRWVDRLLKATNSEAIAIAAGESDKTELKSVSGKPRPVAPSHHVARAGPLGVLTRHLAVLHRKHRAESKAENPISWTDSTPDSVDNKTVKKVTTRVADTAAECISQHYT